MNRSANSDSSVSSEVAIVTWAPIVVFVVSLTFWSTGLDAFNYPKQAILLSGCGALVVVHFFSLRNRKFSSLDIYFLGLTLMIIFLTVANSSWQLRLWWGMFGRANGSLTYLGFVLLSAVIALNFRKKLLDRMYLMALLSLLAQVTYGALQFLDLDPVPWNNPHSPVITFFGNPNFSAASFGFLTVALLKFFKTDHKGILNFLISNYLVIGLAILALFLNYQTRSIQGLATIAAGFYFYILFRLFESSLSKVKRRLLTLVYFLAPIPIAFGVFGIGPFSILKQQTILNRLEYWKVAVRILRDFPMTGVGADGYGLFYGAYRSLEYTQKYGPSLNSSAAHNVILQWGSSFGIFGILGYLSILGLTLASSIFLYKKIVGEERKLFLITFVTWLTYQLTSLISLEQIGVAVWGWAFSGLLIGWAFKLKRANLGTTDIKVKSKVKITDSSGLDGLILLLIVILLYPATSVVRNDLTLRNALSYAGVSAGLQGSKLEERGNRIFNSAKMVAGDRDYLRLALITLYEEGPASTGVRLADLGLLLEPRNTQALEGLAIEAVNSNRWEKVVQFRSAILKIDPFDYLNEAKLANAYYKMENIELALLHFSNANLKGLKDPEMTEFIQLEKLIREEQKN